jgi:hypothetical protein
VKISTSLILSLLKAKFIVFTLDEFIEAKKDILDKSLPTAGLLEDYEYLSVMTKETGKCDGFFIIFREEVYTSSNPIIIENKPSFTLNELAKLYCDTSIDQKYFYEIIEKEAAKQDLEPTSLNLQFEIYVEAINRTRYISEHKFQRNEPCPCGSGKKYKLCHGVLA